MNALFGHLNATRRAAVAMMFDRQKVEASQPRPRPEPMSDEHLAHLKGRCERRFAVIDNLPKEVRAIIHEYGWRCVKAVMDLGVQEPRMIRHYIREIRDERNSSLPAQEAE